MRIKDFGFSDCSDKELMKVAKKLGLDRLNYDKLYTLNKVGQKNSSPLGYPSKMIAIERAIPSIFGHKDDNKLSIRLYFGNNRYFFATSSILSLKKKKKKGLFLIETENSFYELQENL